MTVDRMLKQYTVAEYRKIPVQIQAILLDKYSLNSVIEFVGKDVILTGHDTGGRVYILIKTLEGNVKVKSGDYVIRGVKGEFYPCRKDIFDMTYEEVT